jgi:hypothetical protein
MERDADVTRPFSLIRFQFVAQGKIRWDGTPGIYVRGFSDLGDDLVLEEEYKNTGILQVGVFG